LLPHALRRYTPGEPAPWPSSSAPLCHARRSRPWPRYGATPAPRTADAVSARKFSRS